MTTTIVTVGGVRVVSGTVHVPSRGPWWADLVLERDDDVSGRVDLVLGASTTLRGTVVAGASGVFGGQRRLRMVAGADGWRQPLERRSYHNDGGVRAQLVASDAASAVGETLGDTLSETLGVDFIREAGPASVVLEAAAGASGWWVDFDGVTRVGARSTSTPAAGSYELLSFDPVNQTATIEANDVGAVGIGSVLAADERLPEARTVREIRIEIAASSITIQAWTGGDEATRSRGVRALEAFVERVLARRLLVPLRYRVIRMSGDRAELQAVSDGAPDIGPVSLRPGMSGLHASLTPGALVDVSFADGDRTRPRIVAFDGKDASGWSPASLTLDATGASASIKLGASATEAPAWASKLLAELNKIVTTLGTGTANLGTGVVTFGTPYVAPLSAAALGAAKTVCE